MTSENRYDSYYGGGVPPGDVAAPRNAPPLSHDYQFALEIQKAIGELGAKVDRVIKDNEGQGTKLDELRQQVSFVKGAIYIVGILAAILSFLIANQVHLSFGNWSKDEVSSKQAAPLSAVPRPQ